ncbi:MAG: CoA transferase [Betaproteobacteria bacterium]|nr:CoA transferase [Betaproteobacteria bacterium]
MELIRRNGPLAGLRCVEFAGMGPGPHCAMMLSDLGAEVLRIERPNPAEFTINPITERGRAKLVLDLRQPQNTVRALEIVSHADVLIEGNRPGVMERLGLGPDEAMAANPRLIYGRMTGWGQEGPLAARAGHDLSYLAITGALHAFARKDELPVPPMNLVADFGGGSMLLVCGILAALWERERSGRGQVVDAAIIDGVATLFAGATGHVARGSLSLERGDNILAGASNYYRVYMCKDGKEIAVAAVEPQFYQALLEGIGAPLEWMDDQHDQSVWAERSAAMALIFLTKTRDEWTDILEDRDACAAPVLEFHETPSHRQVEARTCYALHAGIVQQAPAPRFSRTPGAIGPTESGEAMLGRWGLGSPRLL